MILMLFFRTGLRATYTVLAGDLVPAAPCWWPLL